MALDIPRARRTCLAAIVGYREVDRVLQRMQRGEQVGTELTRKLIAAAKPVSELGTIIVEAAED